MTHDAVSAFPLRPIVLFPGWMSYDVLAPVPVPVQWHVVQRHLFLFPGVLATHAWCVCKWRYRKSVNIPARQRAVINTVPTAAPTRQMWRMLQCCRCDWDGCVSQRQIKYTVPPAITASVKRERRQAEHHNLSQCIYRRASD